MLDNSSYNYLTPLTVFVLVVTVFVGYFLFQYSNLSSRYFYMGKIEKCAMRLVAHKKSKIEMQLEKVLNLIVSDVRMTKTFVSQPSQ